MQAKSVQNEKPNTRLKQVYNADECDKIYIQLNFYY